MEVINEVTAINRRIEAIAAGPVEPRVGFEVVVASFEAHPNRITAPIDGTRAEIDRIVRSNAAAARIDPQLIDAIIANESSFDTNAISKAGARGLMQLMPETAASLGIADPFDPGQNVAGGTRYLRALLDRFGDVELAVAAYNAGPAAVERYGGVPPFGETRKYVHKVLARYHELLAEKL